MIGSGIVFSVGMFIDTVPLEVAHLMVAVVMGLAAYIHLKEGELVSSVSISAISGAFLTLVLSSVTTVSFYPLTILMVAIGVIGGIHNILTGIRG